MKTATCTLHVDADHPCLAGHFPGDPVVPGVLILERIAAALGRFRPDVRVIGIRQAKFLRALRPGQRMTVSLRAAVTGEIAFEGRIDSTVHVRGAFLVQPGPSSP